MNIKIGHLILILACILVLSSFANAMPSDVEVASGSGEIIYVKNSDAVVEITFNDNNDTLIIPVSNNMSWIDYKLNYDNITYRSVTLIPKENNTSKYYQYIFYYNNTSKYVNAIGNYSDSDVSIVRLDKNSFYEGLICRFSTGNEPSLLSHNTSSQNTSSNTTAYYMPDYLLTIALILLILIAFSISFKITKIYFRRKKGGED